MIIHRRFSALSLTIVLLALLISLLVPASASAHERRTIANGGAEVVVGWLGEPAYLDQPNGVDFRVANPATKAPIEGLEKTVKVEITKGGVNRTFDLRTRFGQPGAYTADLIPTSTGDYSFRFTGEINGVKIDEKFESGPGRFDGIRPLNTVQFPAAQPTIAELRGELVDARSAADAARLLGIIGIVAGVAGLAAAAGSLVLRRPAGAPQRAAGADD